MPTKRETVLSALFTILQGIGGGVTILRNEVLPERVSADGLLILRDGTPAAFDALAEKVGQAIIADRTLGGRCDWIENDAPEPVDLAVEGATNIKAAVLMLTVHYVSNDPLA